jgi:riboflavin biosynthesis pyrimidine reductase
MLKGNEADMIRQIFPSPDRQLALQGYYLKQDLRALAAARTAPFLYSNFVLSLDGRIALPRPDQAGMKVPEATANERDWRLFQELAVQADLLITSGRYLRDYAAGQAQEILAVYDDPRFEDLKTWRQAQGLPLYPDLAVISGSLEFPIPESLTQKNRKVLIFTDASASKKRITELENQLGQVIIAGDMGVKGDLLREALHTRGYRIIYNTAGPKVMHLLLAGELLDRLYLTFTSRILGGDPFSSIVEGELLEPVADFRLTQLAYDPQAPDGLGQLFARYDRA